VERPFGYFTPGRCRVVEAKAGFFADSGRNQRFGDSRHSDESLSGADHCDCAWLGVGYGGEQVRYQLAQIGKSVRASAQDDNGYRVSRDVLLKSEIAIDGNEYIEFFW
jgi:hypothetical protein